MTTMTNLFVRVYTALVKFYPSRFYELFSEEVVSTFNDLLDEQTDRGVGSLVWVWLSETAGLVLSIFRERWRVQLAKGIAMKLGDWSWHKLAAVILPPLFVIAASQFNGGVFYVGTGPMMCLSQDGSMISCAVFSNAPSLLVR